MGQVGKIKVYVAGLAALVLLIATIAVFMVLSKGRSEGETLASDEQALPSGTVTITSIESGVPVTSAGEASSGSSDTEDYSSYPLSTPSDCQAVIDAYAADHGIEVFEYPIEIVNLLMSDHETLDFVLHYPELIGTQDSPDYPGSIDVSGEYSPLKVPEYYQYDLRWGYRSYVGNVLGINGSGPTALSMVASYLLNNSDMNPAWMAGYAENNGYTTDGGTSWTLMSDGAIGLGIDVTPIPADEDRVDRNLDVGNLVVCLMGPGDFTDTAQFIVIVGYSDEGYEIRDPGSPIRTHETWSFDALASQMNGCWVMRIL
ncbi:MAG: C39 family peptidase [Clostridiales bacterium]|nr:C39 family peptidase [Clostridiales bacterium]